LLVVASVHQPSTSTFNLFDRLLLLSQGHTVYNGTVHNLSNYFNRQGYQMPHYINPAEFVLQIVSTDFASNQELAEANLLSLIEGWNKSPEVKAMQHEILHVRNYGLGEFVDESELRTPCQMLLLPLTLVHRSFIKSYRDVIAYGIRIAMYVGLAVLMGTVWLRLSTVQDNIVAFTNAIFYGGAFMSFMAVAYIPSFLEDRSLYVKERANGLYGPTAFMISNFIIGLPFLFLITLLFSALVYWLSNYRPTAGGFWMWVLWLFLDLLAAESLVILVTNIVPIFVVSLAVVAFANGLWMSVNGFMVPPHTLNVFWRFTFHYIDYQAYVFKGMMVNEFSGRTYECERLFGGGCHCIYVTSLQDQCQIDGQGVLQAYGFNHHKTGLWIAILLCIIFVYRLLAWLVLFVKRS
jgi:ABC-type multidrug transport system permease subunit